MKVLRLLNRSALKVCVAMLCLAATSPSLLAQAQPSRLHIDARAPGRPFPHYWERVFGSGRAILSLRDSYRRDLREVKLATGMQYVRFHDILDDSVGVYSEDEHGNPIYNFSYVDEIYDGLLDAGVRPFVELSFMPHKLAAPPPVLHPFWYKPITSPPKDWARWENLVYQFAKHLVDRYGVDEVSQWYFEVWNEPNLDFWAGDPKEATYYELYDHAARAIKRVDARLRVGGPATAQAAWVDRFIKHCADNNVPVDFVSTHVYANDTARDVFGTDTSVPREQMVCRAVKKVYDQVKASARPNLPIEWTEFNASYKNEPQVTDSTYMGPWLADTIRQCDGMLDSLSYWTFSDVFDEQGVVRSPMYGGFGLIAAGGIPKPAFNAFKVLHHLGEERLMADSDSALVTRRGDGSLAIALWNYAPPGAAGSPKTFTLHVAGIPGKLAVTIQRVDAEHGSVVPAYVKMGRPEYPTVKQLTELRKAAELPAPEVRTVSDNEILLSVPPHGLAMVEVAHKQSPSVVAETH